MLLKRIFTACILISSLAFGQEKPAGASSFTLQQAIDYAMSHQVKVLNAELDVKNAKAKADEIRGIGLPQISASIDMKNFLERPTSLIPAEFFGGPAGTYKGLQFGTIYNTTAGIEATELLFDGTYLVGLQAIRVYLDLSKRAVKQSKIDLALAVTKAYYSLLVATERMKLLDSNIDRVKKLKNDTKVLFDNGFVEKVDLDRVEVAYNNLVTEKEKIERILAISNSLLKFQMGMDQKEQLELADKLGDINFQMTDLSAEKFDYSKRNEYSLVETQLKANQLLLMKERASFLPNVVLYGSAGKTIQQDKFELFGSNDTWYPTVVVGGRLGIPIFSGGQKHYKVQQGKIAVMKTENEKKMLEQSIDLDIATSRSMLQNSASTLETQKKNIRLAEDVYRITKMKYEQGVGSNLEVMNAETALKESQTNYFSALYDALIAKAEYEKAHGNLIK